MTVESNLSKLRGLIGVFNFIWSWLIMSLCWGYRGVCQYTAILGIYIVFYIGSGPIIWCCNVLIKKYWDITDDILAPFAVIMFCVVNDYENNEFLQRYETVTYIAMIIWKIPMILFMVLMLFNNECRHSDDGGPSLADLLLQIIVLDIIFCSIILSAQFITSRRYQYLIGSKQSTIYFCFGVSLFCMEIINIILFSLDTTFFNIGSLSIIWIILLIFSVPFLSPILYSYYFRSKLYDYGIDKDTFQWLFAGDKSTLIDKMYIMYHITFNHLENESNAKLNSCTYYNDEECRKQQLQYIAIQQLHDRINHIKSIKSMNRDNCWDKNNIYSIIYLMIKLYSLIHPILWLFLKFENNKLLIDKHIISVTNALRGLYMIAFTFLIIFGFFISFYEYCYQLIRVCLIDHRRFEQLRDYNLPNKFKSISEKRHILQCLVGQNIPKHIAIIIITFCY